MVKVVKFGGSSLASAEQFTKVGDIIRSDESRKYVVPSAPGKRNSKDTKVTDMLYACYDHGSAMIIACIKHICYLCVFGISLSRCTRHNIFS